MRKLAYLFRRGRPVVVPVLAAASVLMLAAGVGVGTRPASAGIKPTCQWQALNLINGWRSEQSGYDSGDPSYCVSDGMVYLSGSMTQAVNEGTEFAVLPQEAWPTHNLYLAVYTYNGADGSVQIDTDGSMYAFGGDAAGYTSLAGISFPVPDTGTALPLLNGWQSAQSAWDTGDPSYTVTNGTVYLSGSLFQNTNTWGASAMLPPGARPAYAITMAVYSFGGVLALLHVYPDGPIWVGGGKAQQFTSLAGLSFPAASVSSQQLNLLNGWLAPQNTYAAIGPSWYVSDNVVHLFGYMYNPVSNPEFAALPQGLWPTHTLYLNAFFSDANNPNAILTAILRINPDGSMYALGIPPNAPSNDFFVLDGISYHSGS